MNKTYFLIATFIMSLLNSGCKTIVNILAFHPNTFDVIQTNELPRGIEEFTIETEDNIKITSLYLPVISSNKVLIYFHGNAGNIYHRIPTLLQLQKYGLNIVGVSYRGYGKSEGKPSEDGIYQDGKAIFNYVNKKLGFNTKNIIIFGRSIGTTVAINTAENKDIRNLMLVTPLTSGKAHARLGILSPISFLAGDSFNNIRKIKNIHVPILIIHGTHDKVIPYAMGKEIFDAAISKKTLITIDQAGHNDLDDVYAKKYWTSISQFLDPS